jgi:hypothetical protein
MACSQVDKSAFVETAVCAAGSRYGATVASTEDLAADFGVDEGDVRVLLRQLGEQAPEAPDDLAEFVRRLLDPHAANRTGQLVLARSRGSAAPGVRAR